VLHIAAAGIQPTAFILSGFFSVGMTGS